MPKLLDDEDLFSGGWIKVHRSILFHQVFQDSELLHLFLYCLAKANHKPGRVLNPKSDGGELTVERGQFIFGQRKAAKETGVNPRTAHRKLVLLEKLGILTRSVSRRFTVVTVNNYARYQDNPHEPYPHPDSLVSHTCPTSVPLVSTNKNIKNVKNDKNKRIFSSCSIEYELSKFLLSEIRENDENFLSGSPNAEELAIQRWALDIERLIKLDHRSTEEIKTVIEFAQSNRFWKSNILSAKKLREKYTTLLLQSQTSPSGGLKPNHLKPSNGKVHPCEIVI